MSINTMIKPNKLEKQSADILNTAITFEMEAYYAYRNLGNCMKNKGFELFAGFLYSEAESELQHAHKLQQYLTDWNIQPDFKAPKIGKQIFEFAEVVSTAYQMEYDLYLFYEEKSKEILDAGDTCTYDFLHFFRNVQVESVKEYSDIINQLELITDKNGMNMLLFEAKYFKK